MNLATENAIDSPLVEKKRTPRGATITKIDAGYIDAALLGMFQIEIRQTRDAIIYLLSNPHPDYDCISENLGIDYSFLDHGDFEGFVEHVRYKLEHPLEGIFQLQEIEAGQPILQEIDGGIFDPELHGKLNIKILETRIKTREVVSIKIEYADDLPKWLHAKDLEVLDYTSTTDFLDSLSTQISQAKERHIKLRELFPIDDFPTVPERISGERIHSELKGIQFEIAPNLLKASGDQASWEVKVLRNEQINTLPTWSTRFLIHVNGMTFLNPKIIFDELKKHAEHLASLYKRRITG